jgi:hypothetical protein
MRTIDRLSRWGAARLSRRLAVSVPLLGTAIALATVAVTVRRKGMVGGILDTSLNATPLVGTAKNVFEMLRGEDLLPDRRADGRRRRSRSARIDSTR